MKLPSRQDLPEGVSLDHLIEVCRRWKVRELALFGSVARGESTAASDIDVMVTFEPDAAWSLLDHVAAQDDLAHVFRRPVDLVTRNAIESSGNQLRRRAILDSARVIYAA